MLLAPRAGIPGRLFAPAAPAASTVGDGMK